MKLEELLLTMGLIASLAAQYVTAACQGGERARVQVQEVRSEIVRVLEGIGDGL